METCLQRNIVNGSGGSVVCMTEAILTAELFLIRVQEDGKLYLLNQWRPALRALAVRVTQVVTETTGVYIH
jgi:hypothetical protein